MRDYLLIATIVLAGMSGAARVAAAAEDYPYTAYVSVPQTNVHSGPSRNFYPTDELFEGDQVEVYRREGSSWLGIRPPTGSFSWVPADTVEETDDEGIHRVLIETQSWIGTLFPSVREHKYQVKLRPGELIEVIGQKTVQSTEGNETWLKIAPPAGEFRWIHVSQVSRTPPREAEPAALTSTKRDLPELQRAIGTGVNRAKDSLTALAAATERPIKPAQHAIILTDLTPPVNDHIALHDAKKSEREDVRPAQHQQTIDLSRSNAIAPDGFVPRKPRRIDNTAGVPAPSTELRMASSERLQNSIHETPRVQSQPNQASSGPARTTTVQPLTLSNQPAFDSANASEKLTQLDLELSLRIAQPRETWNLEPIRVQAQKIVDGGQTPQERGQARLLLEKIRKFEETFDLPNDPLIAATRGGAASAADARYDGVGMLQPVISRDGQTKIAPYAIVDADGNPVAFVTPGPGMNLRRYENKPVGIYGKRGMVEAIRKPHLVAERVIDLSQR
ncbi:hypothetical protein ETAA8_61900 [Anatilimnocola aggregata]|uniref:SH3 domain-containing protein n=1 Tax=Anatilimnocola aggregata TaxID=2528021 RepID=A0A517YLD2_9BACT|nr:SH3 domain-containing protein [Anatilimnocola aggregata]QDU31037.1 hypothetical protein ETAA8_61900 [Anatilimnocola aggregata]